MNTPLNDAPTREQLIAFLDGSGTIDGLAFGDTDTTKRRPHFWWRKYLPLLANTPDSAAQGAMVGDYCSLSNAEVALKLLAQSDDLVGNYHIATLQSYLAGQVAQPSDATAQPMDLTEEQICRALNEQGMQTHSAGYETIIDGVPAALMLKGTKAIIAAFHALANTAQGKPEHIALDAARFNALRELATLGNGATEIMEQAEKLAALPNEDRNPTADDFNAVADAIAATLAAKKG